MLYLAPGGPFGEPIGGRFIQVADIPNLNFALKNPKIDVRTGDIARFEFEEPVYAPAGELSDDLPLVDVRVTQPLPVFAGTQTEAVGAYLVSTDDLALDIWLQPARAYMSHLCPPPKPGKKSTVKPLYRLQLGTALRYKLTIDTEVWTRKLDPKTGAFSPWTKTRIDKGKPIKRQTPILLGNTYTLNQFKDQLPCIELPQGSPRDQWTLMAPVVVRNFALPYIPTASATPTDPPND